MRAERQNQSPDQKFLHFSGCQAVESLRSASPPAAAVRRLSGTFT